jgi:hypothetical protein
MVDHNNKRMVDHNDNRMVDQDENRMTDHNKKRSQKVVPTISPNPESRARPGNRGIASKFESGDSKIESCPSRPGGWTIRFGHAKQTPVKLSDDRPDRWIW